jgi:L-galactose dehydrogenase/L-glyceraldehyde 3-phosphate reductase
MSYRRFGRTGLQISQLAFGGGRSGGILIDPDDDTKRRAVRLALDHGINWFDTAPQYGQGKSEEALGWLLEEIDERPHVSTKVMVGADDLDDIAGRVERSLNESLRRLRRDSVDLLQLHNRIDASASNRAITAAHVLGRNGVAEGMERLREQGLIRFMGLTALGDNRETRKVIDSGRFDTAQVYFNMINPSAARDAMPAPWPGFDSTGIMAACRAQDMGIMAIRIFAASYLASPVRTGRESILTADTDPESESRMAEAVFAALGDAYGSRAQTAVRFVLSRPDVSTAIVGLAEPSHLAEAAAAAAMGPLPAAALDCLEALYDSGFEAAG